MPELPEVETFRRRLLPLISNEFPLRVELVGENPPTRNFVTAAEVAAINQKRVLVTDIRRRGKLICIETRTSTISGSSSSSAPTKTKTVSKNRARPTSKKEEKEGSQEEHEQKRQDSPGEKWFLFVHMGMTGRISVPNRSFGWGHSSNLTATATIQKRNTFDTALNEEKPAEEEQQADEEEDDDDENGQDGDDDDEEEITFRKKKNNKGGQRNKKRDAAGGSSVDYPPPHTHLRFRVGTTVDVCFADPRKFGKVSWTNSDSELQALAPDALEFWEHNHESNTTTTAGADATTSSSVLLPEILIHRLTGLSMGIKAVLLDQKRVVSGVGNWVADEVLYQTALHPNQTHLTTDQATTLLQTLRDILQTAVNCLEHNQSYPPDWLFHYRWDKKKKQKSTKRNANNGTTTTTTTATDNSPQDAHGRTISFITAGGRTTALVEEIQKLKDQKTIINQSPAAAAVNKRTKPTRKRTAKVDQEQSVCDSNNGDDQDDEIMNGTKNSPAATKNGRKKTVSKRIKTEQSKQTLENDEGDHERRNEIVSTKNDSLPAVAGRKPISGDDAARIHPSPPLRRSDRLRS